jgi:hypothetical protein
VLIPLVVSLLLYCAYDAIQFKSTFGKTDFDLGSFFGLAALISLNLYIAFWAWLIYLVFADRKKWRKLLGLAGAGFLLALGMGTAEFLVTSKIIDWALYVTFVPPLLALSFCGTLALFAGLSSRMLEDEDREWLSRASAGLLLFCAGWVGVCLAVLVVPKWVISWKIWGAGGITAGGTAAGWVTTQLGKREHVGKWGGIALKVAPSVFIAAIAVGLAIGTNAILLALGVVSEAGDYSVPLSWKDHQLLIERSYVLGVIGVAFGFLVLALLMARYININRFSLNAMYRDRLIRAYLGASNPDRAAAAAHSKTIDRGLNKFTGFAESDDLRMDQLTRKPFHVLNLTLNVISGERLAWQQRKAQPFSVTPLHSGSCQVGYRGSGEYARGITLGTAVSISGAAASPSMGSQSSSKLGFIMTLLNARLGAWLGNPGRAGDKTWREPGPRSAIASLVKEALGLANSKSEYVYLSDGGHFENLALYEMVLRRCRTIVLLDSGCDPEFTYGDLGNALRKIRIDLNIPILFDGDSFRNLREKKKRCAVAKIDYAAADGECEPGYLIYIKPMLLGDEPADVVSYATANPAFPHQSTAQQWFNESQTESYRMLGEITMDSVCRNWRAHDALTDLGPHIKNNYLGKVLMVAAATA